MSQSGAARDDGRESRPARGQDPRRAERPDDGAAPGSRSRGERSRVAGASRPPSDDAARGGRPAAPRGPRRDDRPGRPPTAGDARGASADRRPTGTGRPASGDRRPAAGDRRPTGTGRPTTGERRPGSADRRPAAGDRRPVGADRRPAAGDRRPPDGDRRPPARGRAGDADRADAPVRTRRDEPALPDDVVPGDLDRDVRRDLMTLAKDNAEVVARHLVMAGRLLDVDPELAHAHATAAQRRAGRIGAVREAAGLTAYATGRHDEVLRELRAARRLTGSPVHLPLMADAERGLGRPDRALALAASPEVQQLDERGRAEMRIVASGARLDLGQPDAAVVALQGPELTATRPQPWHARTFAAYATALRAAGRAEEAGAWDRRAEALDPSVLTGDPGPGADDDELLVYDAAELPPLPPSADGAGAGSPGPGTTGAAPAGEGDGGAAGPPGDVRFGHGPAR